MHLSEPGTEARPASFTRVAGYQSINVDVPESEVGKKFIFPVRKQRELHKARKEERKTHREPSLAGDHFLAIRCGTADGCIDLHYREAADEGAADIETKFAGDSYSASGHPLRSGRGAIQVAVRALVYEDRFLQFERALFCDKTTEKTVKVTVEDEANSIVPARSTKRLSCMYPLMEIRDVSGDTGRNADAANVPLREA